MIRRAHACARQPRRGAALVAAPERRQFAGGTALSRLPGAQSAANCLRSCSREQPLGPRDSTPGATTLNVGRSRVRDETICADERRLPPDGTRRR